MEFFSLQASGGTGGNIVEAIITWTVLRSTEDSITLIFLKMTVLTQETRWYLQVPHIIKWAKG